MGRGMRRDDMKTNHLFVSAAVVAVLAVTVPTQVFAGHLGGGLGGGFGGGLGGGLGGIGGSMNGGANGAFNSNLNGNGLNRVDRTATSAASACKDKATNT